MRNTTKFRPPKRIHGSLERYRREPEAFLQSTNTTSDILSDDEPSPAPIDPPSTDPEPVASLRKIGRSIAIAGIPPLHLRRLAGSAFNARKFRW
jgi:hypothetical protein